MNENYFQNYILNKIKKKKKNKNMKLGGTGGVFLNCQFT